MSTYNGYEILACTGLFRGWTRPMSQLSLDQYTDALASPITLFQTQELRLQVAALVLIQHELTSVPLRGACKQHK